MLIRRYGVSENPRNKEFCRSYEHLSNGEARLYDTWLEAKNKELEAQETFPDRKFVITVTDRYRP